LLRSTGWRVARALLLLVLLGTLSILRLKRLAKPQSVLVHSYANGALTVHRVVLQRGTDGPQLMLGWQLRCRARELVALRQERAPDLRQIGAMWELTSQHARWQIDVTHCQAVLQP
jgi:hypothetical protein